MPSIDSLRVFASSDGLNCLTISMVPRTLTPLWVAFSLYFALLLPQHGKHSVGSRVDDCEGLWYQRKEGTRRRGRERKCECRLLWVLFVCKHATTWMGGGSVTTDQKRGPLRTPEALFLWGSAMPQIHTKSNWGRYLIVRSRKDWEARDRCLEASWGLLSIINVKFHVS